MVSSVQVANRIDTALDRTIALGYADVGLHIRRRPPGLAGRPPRLDGRIVVMAEPLIEP